MSPTQAAADRIAMSHGSSIPRRDRIPNVSTLRSDRGENAALVTIWSFHAPALRARIQRMVQDADAAADLLQELWQRASARWGQYSGRGPVGAWLHKMAAHPCVDELRRRRATEVRLAEFASEVDLAADSASESERENEARLRERYFDSVTDVMVSLPERERAIALLHWYLDYGPSEIARSLGLRSSTVRTALWKTRRRLRLTVPLPPWARGRGGGTNRLWTLITSAPTRVWSGCGTILGRVAERR